MKKSLFICALFLLAFTISCQKNQKRSNFISAKELKMTFEKNSSSDVSRILPDSFDGGGGYGGCNCNDHGGPRSVSVTWQLATCKSDCEKGIGFRCGRDGILICQDGYFVICTVGSNCPKKDNSRTMTASYTFYDNNTLKLTFQNAVPDSEAANTNFEVEVTELVPLPSNLRLDGVAYAGYITQMGNYTIDYSDGPYGSVIINIQLQQ
jgi:hypothetical protein